MKELNNLLPISTIYTEKVSRISLLTKTIETLCNTFLKNIDKTKLTC